MHRIKSTIMEQFILALIVMVMVINQVVAQTDELAEDALKYQVLEGARTGTVIGDVPRDSGLTILYPPSTLSELRFNILDETGGVLENHPYLSISHTKGILSISGDLDREFYCAGEDKCLIGIEIAVGPAEFYRLISVQLEVMDINDNSPRFPQSYLHVDIPESAITGSGFTIPLAHDPDGLDYGIVSYELRSVNGVPFALRPTPSPRDAISLELVVQEHLDRETVANYEFQVVAFDGGAPSRSGSMTVNVSLTDINDNQPVFESDQYTVQVSENSVVPETVVTVHATDNDVGLNGLVIYELASRSKERYGHLFEVDQDTGVISLLQSLDREEASEYMLTVTAKDQGMGSRLAMTNVMVTVSDVNDNAPMVNVNTLTSGGDPVISEGADIGTFVGLVSVSDPDLGDNGKVTCYLSNGVFELVFMRKNKYKIITGSRLDREEQDTYSTTLNCHDSGTPVLVTENVVTIQVTDENDNRPRFTDLSYTGQVEENSHVGTSVAQVKARDKDIGPNGKVKYSLVGDMSSYFSIDENNGIITTAENIDYEAYDTIRLQVVASDQGSPSLSSRSLVVITVTDTNDEKPVFTDEAYTFVVVENEPVGTELGQLEAYDRDSPPYDTITYGFVNESDIPFEDVFSLDSETGIISTMAILDREIKPVYFLQATAGNEGYPGLTSTTTLTIFVADDNDNAPVIDFPNKENKSVSISNASPVGNIVTTIRAHDLDSGNNAAMSYSMQIFDEQYRDYFIVDSTSGLLYVNKDLSVLDFLRIDSRITVTDHGTRPLSTSCDLVIEVDSTLLVPEDYPVEYPDTGSGDEPDDGNILVIIIVVAISGVLICLLLGAIVFVLLRSRRASSDDESINKEYPGPSEIVDDTGSVTVANRYNMDRVEWLKNNPDRNNLNDDKNYFNNKNKFNKQNNNIKPGRTSPAVAEWERSVVRNNSLELRPSVFEMSSHVPTTRGHELGISYVPDGTFPGGKKRKRSGDRRLGDLRKLQMPSPSDEQPPAVDLDTSSASSGHSDMSNADSGRGASEEGEAPQLPAQDYRKGSIMRNQQGAGYPMLTSFQSPAQTRQASHHASPRPSHNAMPEHEVETPSTSSTLPVNRHAPRNVKPKDKTKNNESVSLPRSSYSLMNNMLSNIEDNNQSSSPPPRSPKETNGYPPFKDSNTLFKFKHPHHTDRHRRSSGTPSEMTDTTASTTSGSYMLHNDHDDATDDASIVTMREVDV